MISGRILQFVRAIFARVSTEDMALVEQYLPSELHPLFFALSVPDQCHALRTARNAMALAGSLGTVDRLLLTRCGH